MTIAPPPVGDDERGKDYTLASAGGADKEPSTPGGGETPGGATFRIGFLENEDVSRETLR